MGIKQQRKSDKIINTRRQAFFDKMVEYDKLTLDELKELFNHPDKKKRVGGIYREALIEVVRNKQLKIADKVIEEKTAEIAAEQQATEEPQQETTTE